MKTKLLSLSIMSLLIFSISIPAQAAGFLPYKEGSTVGYYFVDEANTQYYYDGVATIDGGWYLFNGQGLVDMSANLYSSDPEIKAIVDAHPAKIKSIPANTADNNITQQPTTISLSNGLIMDSSTVTTNKGYNIALTAGKVKLLQYVGFTQISIKYNFQSPTGKGMFDIGLYDADGFLIKKEVITNSVNGENNTVIMYNNADGVALIKVEANSSVFY